MADDSLVVGAPLAGNHVVLDRGGVFAALCHPQRDSVRVSVDGEVREGGVLGLVGCFGNSLMPHLRFQLMDRAVAPHLVGHRGVRAPEHPSERAMDLPLSLPSSPPSTAALSAFPSLKQGFPVALPSLALLSLGPSSGASRERSRPDPAERVRISARENAECSDDFKIQGITCLPMSNANFLHFPAPSGSVAL